MHPDRVAEPLRLALDTALNLHLQLTVNDIVGAEDDPKRLRVACTGRL